MKKQTAVDWYIEERNKLENAIGTREIGLVTYLDRKKEIETQAKQMEKELIQDVHLHAQFKVVEVKKELAEKYYNDFYGGDDE